MSNSSVDKLAVTPEDIAEIQADIPEMAQELGWSKQEPWMHELGERMSKWDAAKVGKHSLRAELVRRLESDRYFNWDIMPQCSFLESDYETPWRPSPISVFRTVKSVQQRVAASNFLEVRVPITTWRAIDCIKIVGVGKPISENSRIHMQTAMVLTLPNCDDAKISTDLIRFVADITGISPKKVEKSLKEELALSQNSREYTHWADPDPKVTLPINPQLLLPQD